jgi:hypothetical protein
LDELLVGFFKFYSQFDFKQNVVSVRTGHLTRDLFPPPAFAARESETRPHHNFEPRRYITIEDIYDVWDNVTRGVGELELQRIQWELLVAYRLLEPYSKQYEKIQLSWTSTQGLLEPFVLPTEGVTQVFGALPKVNNSPSTSPKRIGRNKYKKSIPSITPPSPSTTRLVFSPPSPPALRPQQNSFAMIPPLVNSEGKNSTSEEKYSPSHHSTYPSRPRSSSPPSPPSPSYKTPSQPASKPSNSQNTYNSYKPSFSSYRPPSSSAEAYYYPTFRYKPVKRGSVSNPSEGRSSYPSAFHPAYTNQPRSATSRGY